MVGCTDFDITWLRRLHTSNLARKIGWVSLLCLWCPRHGLANPHRGGQLRRLLQRAEEDRGQGAKEGGAGQAAGVGP